MWTKFEKILKKKYKFFSYWHMYTSSGKVYIDNVTIYFTATCVHVTLTDKFMK